MIEFHDVTVCYEPQKRHPVRSLDGVSLSIERGDWVFLVGPSGAGKSSLLRLVYAGMKAQSGRVVVDSEDISAISAREVPLLRRKIGIVFQDFQLLSEKTAWENVAFALRVIGTPQSVIVREVPRALETVGLTHRAEALPHELSGGEQQRIAIARAIVNNPPILLTDEPTGNLDPQTAREVGQLLTKINFERGTTIVMATHDGAFVDELARRVVRLKAGRIVSDENPGSYGHDNEDAAPDLAPIFHPSQIKIAPVVTSKTEALTVEAPKDETSKDETSKAEAPETETLEISAPATPKIEPPVTALTVTVPTVAAPPVAAPPVFEVPQLAVPEVEFVPLAATPIPPLPIAPVAEVEAPAVPLPVAALVSEPVAELLAPVATEAEPIQAKTAEIEAVEIESMAPEPPSEIPVPSAAIEAKTAEAKTVAIEVETAPELAEPETEKLALEPEIEVAPETPQPAPTMPQRIIEAPPLMPISAPAIHHDPYSVDGVQPKTAPRPMARRIAQPVPPPQNGRTLEPDTPAPNPDAPLGSPENPIVQY